MQANKIEPQLITVQQAEQQDKLPGWLTLVGKMSFWLSVALFLKAFVDAVNLSFR